MNTEQLIAYLDGEGEAGERDAVEAAMAHDPALRAQLTILIRQRLLLAELCREAGRQPVSGSPTAASSDRPAPIAGPSTAGRFAPSTRRASRPWIIASVASIAIAALVAFLAPLRSAAAAVDARIVAGEADARLIRLGHAVPVQHGSPLREGDHISASAHGSVRIAYLDGSQIEFAPDAGATIAHGPMKGLVEQTGTVIAEISPQPPPQHFSIANALVQVTVIGTRFTLRSDATTTRLEVEHGTVGLSRRSDGAEVMVRAGEFTVATATEPLATRRLAADPPSVATDLSGVAPDGAVIPAKPWAKATVGLDDGQLMPSEIEPITDQPFTEALFVQTPPLEMSEYDDGEHRLLVRVPTTSALTKGEMLVARFWVRSAVQGRSAHARLVFEGAREPHAKSLSAAVGADGSWHLIELPFRAIDTYRAGDAELQFWLGQEPQAIELAGLTLEKRAAQSGETTGYDGSRHDAPWREEASARIHMRQAQLSLRVVDATGVAVPGARIVVNQQRSSIMPATNVMPEQVLGAGKDEDRYRRELLSRFPIATLRKTLSWWEWERDRGTAVNAVTWLAGHGLAVHGTGLISPDRLPKDAAASDDNELLHRRIANHIEAEVGTLAGKVALWNVVDDPYSGGFLLTKLGRAELLRWFVLARQADPAAKLYLGMDGLLEDCGNDLRRQEYYLRLIPWLLEQHAPLDGLDVGCYLASRLTPPARLADILARFARFGLPLRIDNFNVVLHDAMLRAAYVRDALTVFQAEPAVISVSTSGFWDGSHVIPEAALLAHDWSPTFAGMAWDAIMGGAKRDPMTAITDVDGRWSSRLATGDYRIVASHGAESGEVSISLDGAVDTTVVVRSPNH